MAFSAEFIAARIAALEARLVKYEEALSFLADNPMKSYTLDTGQGMQKVTRDDIDMLNGVYNSVLNSLNTWMIRQNGGNSVVVRPCF